MSGQAKNIDALVVRDAALKLLRRVGKPITTAGATPFRTMAGESDGFRVVHSTPFNPPPAVTETMRRALAAASRAPLPYTLDLWDGTHGKDIFLGLR